MCVCVCVFVCFIDLHLYFSLCSLSLERPSIIADPYISLSLSLSVLRLVCVCVCVGQITSLSHLLSLSFSLSLPWELLLLPLLNSCNMASSSCSVLQLSSESTAHTGEQEQRREESSIDWLILQLKVPISTNSLRSKEDFLVSSVRALSKAPMRFESVHPITVSPN